MKASEIEIPEPCDQDFASMSGEGARRFCEACSCHVHDLSNMTQQEAEALLARHDETPICVRFEARGDEIVLAPSRLERQRRGARRLLAAAALLAAPLAACSADAPTPEPVPIEPAQSEAPSVEERDRLDGLFRGAQATPNLVDEAAEHASRERLAREAAEREAAEREAAKADRVDREAVPKCGLGEPEPTRVDGLHANCIEVSGPSGTRTIHLHDDSVASSSQEERPAVPRIRTMGRIAEPHVLD